MLMMIPKQRMSSAPWECPYDLVRARISVNVPSAQQASSPSSSFPNRIVRNTFRRVKVALWLEP